MQHNADIHKYVVIDAAGNVVLLIDAGSTISTAYGQQVRHAVKSCEGDVRIDIVAFLSRFDGAMVASFWNPDGTPEKMCGNACRSIPLGLQTWLGLHRAPTLFSVLTEFCRVKVAINADGTTSAEFPMAAISRSHFPETNDPLIDVGTPHVVRKVEELFSEHVNYDGERLSTAAMPVNATFCKVTPNEIIARTFERGVGETKSCGTGAIAVAIALEKQGSIDRLPHPRVIRFVSGEKLLVSYGPGNVSVAISGRCKLISSGIMSLRSLEVSVRGL